ncbi:MAG: hypothetical protein ACTHLN_15520 [Tepidisphaeraceae bacterium]
MAHQRLIKHIYTSAALAVAIAGCQAPQPATPPAEPAAVKAAPTASTTPAVSTNPRADAAARQAEQQAKAIDELLAARAQSDAQDRGLTIVEPKSSTPPVPQEKTPAEAAAAPVPVPTVPPPTVPPPSIPQIEPAPTKAPAIVVVTNKYSRIATPPAPTTTLPPAPVEAAAPAPAIEPIAPANTGIIAQQPPAAIPPAPPPAAKPEVGDSLEQQLAKRANEYPRDVAAQLDNQLLAYLKDQPAPDAAALGQLPAEDREIITAVIDGLSNFRNGVRNDNNMLMNRKIRPLVEMADRLKSRADLSINNAQLCTVVRGFGAYTPFEPARLVYGQPRQLAVYCEVQNFVSQFDDKGMWSTKLQMDLVLYTNGGMDVWHMRGIAVDDTCRNRRHDFFIAKAITLPAGLAIDQYSLKITISDLNASRVAETTIPVGVVAAQK